LQQAVQPDHHLQQLLKKATAILSQTPLHNNKTTFSWTSQRSPQKSSRKETKTIIVLYLQKYVRTHAHLTSPLSTCPLKTVKSPLGSCLSIFCSIYSLINELLNWMCCAETKFTLPHVFWYHFKMLCQWKMVWNF
jgi:hypothetical protein